MIEAIKQIVFELTSTAMGIAFIFSYSAIMIGSIIKIIRKAIIGNYPENIHKTIREQFGKDK